jgi:hypothetical protein
VNARFVRSDVLPSTSEIMLKQRKAAEGASVLLASAVSTT